MDEQTAPIASASATQLELYSEFGITAEKAQVLEFEAGNVALSFIAFFVGTDHITPEKTEMFRGLVDDVNRKTLGALLRNIKSLANFDEALIGIVDEALERRNYLMHRFFPNHNFAIFDEAGRRAMIEELEEIQAKLDRAHHALSAVSSLLTKMAGRDSAEPESIAQNFVTQAKRVDL